MTLSSKNLQPSDSVYQEQCSSLLPSKVKTGKKRKMWDMKSWPLDDVRVEMTSELLWLNIWQGCLVGEEGERHSCCRSYTGQLRQPRATPGLSGLKLILSLEASPQLYPTC